ncbi:hypothetical protein [Paenibacillus sp. NAIST15-1]|uniref:hypothetical protein n=1 Tax=Paenibacillus sp. NAIST15-1 TaxID=1605994 RepID=UPI00086D4D50|nr:hypothetical protein [Paenibacillus sp. NAIST15-1]GAV11457.1 hypothetical protein PBN151_1386 [Paenibacillus sp. NAIST15-1]
MKCERCGSNFVKQTDDDVCDVCLTELELEYNGELDINAKAFREALNRKSWDIKTKMISAQRYEKARLEGQYELLQWVWEYTGGDRVIDSGGIGDE